jgi:hypothetical protein
MALGVSWIRNSVHVGQLVLLRLACVNNANTLSSAVQFDSVASQCPLLCHVYSESYFADPRWNLFGQGRSEVSLILLIFSGLGYSCLYL